MEFLNKNPKIYIISGKAHSGKNTISKIIKNTYIDKKCIDLAYASYLKMYAHNILSWDMNDDTKPREFLQQLGVELIKNNINDKMLINRMIEDIKVYSYFYDIILITDARFPEEIDIIRNSFNNVTVIHVFGRDNNLLDNEKKHTSEVSLDNYNNYDYDIDNSVSYEHLENEIKKIIKES